MPLTDQLHSPINGFLESVQGAADNTSPEQDEDFWTHDEIDATRWNKAFPYQLMLVKADEDGNYIATTTQAEDGTTDRWLYTFPFPPESLQITMPFAITGSVTQGGYLEEHNGAPIRNLTFSGTTGVLPLRPSAATRKQPNLAEAIFAGTIEQGNRIVNSAKSFSSDFTGTNPNFAPNIVDEKLFDNVDNDDTNIAITSGYYQFRLLQEFFENYVAFKKTAGGRDYRLAFATWKDQSVYLVTPQTYTVSRSAGSPYEYAYSISFRAWRRVNLGNSAKGQAQNQFKPAVLKNNVLARMLKAILDARSILENARDVISAVGGDLDKALFEPLRQTTMFIKDQLSVALSFADLPTQILNDSKGAVIQFISTKQAFEGASETLGGVQKVSDAYKNLANLGAATSKVETGQGNLRQSSAFDTDPALDVFNHPDDNYDLFSTVQTSRVNLPPTVIRSITNERRRIRLLKRLDFEQMRDTIVQLQADFNDAVGAGNDTYNRTFQRASRAVSKTPTPTDFQVLFALNRVIMEMNRLAASGATDKTLRSVDYVAGLASQAGIAFTIPKSKFAIPYPYGVTLEQLATRYLGSPDRWIEIATLNGLRAPYVDEEGFDLPLLVNGNGNQVSVADSSHLFVGQQVWIQSTTNTRTVRRVTKIEVLSPSNSVVTVDGDSDLDRYSTLANATMHAYLPDTVNSQMMLYIPSQRAPATQDYQMRAVPGLDEFDQLLNAGGFDLLLTSTNDLAITPDGDCRLAVGLANVVQIARIRLTVVQGTLNRHPNFGLPIKPGISTADLDAKTLLKVAKNLFNDDPLFTGVQSASVSIKGPVASIALGVTVRGQTQVIPITLNVK